MSNSTSPNRIEVCADQLVEGDQVVLPDAYGEHFLHVVFSVVTRHDGQLGIRFERSARHPELREYITAGPFDLFTVEFE